MKAREAFGVVVRTLGLIGMLLGVVGIVSAIIVSARGSDAILLSVIAINVLYLAIGFLLLAKPDWFVKFAYGPDQID